jgi:starch synthase
MFIFHVASELTPFAQVGGMGDVVYGLAHEHSIRGDEVMVIVPKYNCARFDQVFDMKREFNDLWVPYYGEWVHCSVDFGFVHGVKTFFIEPHHHKDWFNRGCVYGCHDDVERFAFFCKAALEYLLKTKRHPDIIHCHDWQTGLVPLMLFETYKGLGLTHPRVCYTIHNMQHQGIQGPHILQQINLDPRVYMNQDKCQDPRYPTAINCMKTGIVFSNFVTTVSPSYMWEIQHGGGHGLDRTLNVHGAKCGGVLNGIDYEIWNPEIDRYIPVKYSVNHVDAKYGNKKALRERLWLRDEYSPIVAVISRLDHQKGVHLIRHALHYALGNGAQFVLLGSSPDHRLNAEFWGLKHRFNDNPDCHLEIGFNAELAHLIYAGADMIVVPSIFEPCGLTQMIGLKYGTVPVVRATGGLKDTVFDAEFTDKPFHERNGYVFNDANEQGLESGLRRAIGMFYDYPKHWRELMENGMRQDHSWHYPGNHYMDIYCHIKD